MIYFIIAILSLSLILIIHEWGHFLFSRLFGVKVEEFGIGYPPRLFSFKKNGVVYSVNAIPFGALTQIYEGEKGKNEPESFWSKSTFQKIMILVAGPLFNILLAFLILTILFAVGFPQEVVPFPIFEGEVVIKYSVPQAMVHSIEFMGIILRESIIGMGQAFYNLFFKAQIQDFVGPIGLVAISQQAVQLGVTQSLYFFALISYVLGIFNLLPIPALDGGRVFLILIEKIRRKPISAKSENLINNIAFSLLIILLIIVSIKDVFVFIF